MAVFGNRAFEDARAVPADVLAGVEPKMAKACAGRKENALFM